MKSRVQVTAHSEEGMGREDEGRSFLGKIIGEIKNMGSIKDYRELIVWRKSMDLVVEIYKITGTYPKSERFGLISQMQRSAVSIPSNIAEGYRRSTRKDYRNFVLIAYGSSSELETQIEIAKRLHYVSIEQSEKIDKILLEVVKMLNALQNSLKQKNP